MSRLPIKVITSGLQTGVDQAGLWVAEELDYPTGGMAPKGWRTDAGPNSVLGLRWGLRQSNLRQYLPRTLYNARQADITVWFGVDSPGRRATVLGARWLLDNPTATEIRDAVECCAAFAGEDIVLNVAGNRWATHPESTVLALQVLREALA